MICVAFLEKLFIEFTTYKVFFLKKKKNYYYTRKVPE